MNEADRAQASVRAMRKTISYMQQNPCATQQCRATDTNLFTKQAPEPSIRKVSRFKPCESNFRPDDQYEADDDPKSDRPRSANVSSRSPSKGSPVQDLQSSLEVASKSPKSRRQRALAAGHPDTPDNRSCASSPSTFHGNTWRRYIENDINQSNLTKEGTTMHKDSKPINKSVHKDSSIRLDRCHGMSCRCLDCQYHPPAQSGMLVERSRDGTLYTNGVKQHISASMTETKAQPSKVQRNTIAQHARLQTYQSGQPLFYKEPLSTSVPSTGCDSNVPFTMATKEALEIPRKKLRLEGRKARGYFEGYLDEVAGTTETKEAYPSILEPAGC
ncbi:hypothetical protein EJ05DRAFT_484892 [Pseudovirgaria hyperparasitica]|uniref:Uncharacterized protein n=1 Tax=Pseudovirgaria hyperparasitica TaxID=470096 RepID=A0A6A6WCW1_9PEZI|nr:uncharacterized protein EJ05DRAFT_484892 [Pseudovirgaria hyperparasitica]KAF2760019.1 hypothetical protein EJ05DRAFT_484892 [Pseudovirgaria hyperparasitica]